jgi:SAM-dependent methyltransferase
MSWAISVDEHTKALFPGCSTEEIIQKAQKVRDEAIRRDIRYGCISQLYFLETSLYKNPFYKEYLQQYGGLHDKKVADVGCCLGTDTRRMLLDGLDSQNFVAFDLSENFVSLGFQLFEDKESPISCRFFAKSVLDEDLAAFIQQRYHLIPLDVVLVNSVLHSFEEAQAKIALRNIASLLKPGGVVLGYIPTKPDNPAKVSAGGNAYRYFHTESSILYLLEENGFENGRVYTVPIREMFPSFHATEETGMEDRLCITFFMANKRINSLHYVSHDSSIA